MRADLTNAQRQRLQTLWDIAQNDLAYKEMLRQMRDLEKHYEDTIEKMSGDDRDTVCDFVSLCEEMSWRILEIAAVKMIFRFETE